MKGLGLDISYNLSKQDARKIIEEALNKEEKVEIVKPGKVDNGFHLSPESCRAEALKCALRTEYENLSEVLETAKIFLDFIEN